MTIAEQLHKSAFHKPGLDPACPVCNPTLGQDIKGIIRDLERCAVQNEKDAKGSAGFCPRDCAQAGAVAAEQRRVIRLLKAVL